MKTNVNFDKAQRAVIEANDEYNLVLAPPGCGKTEILSHRILYAANNGVKFSDMICLTFTNRASRGMYERIRQTISDPSVSEMFVGNIHRFCMQFLMNNKIVSPEVGIVDENDIKDILLMFEMRKLGIAIEKERYFIGAVMAKSHRMMQAKYKDDEDLMLYPEEKTEFSINGDNTDYSGKVTEYAERYNEYKKDNNLMDFDDFLIETYQALKSPTYKEDFVGVDYKWAQVDEVQDMNPLQFAILDKITANEGKTVMYLGDAQQAIFSFMGAKLSSLETLTKRAGGKVMSLERNYRSPKYLLDIFNEFAQKELHIDKAFLPSTENTDWPTKGDLRTIHSNTLGEQCSTVCDCVSKAIKDYPDDRVAVLVRTNKAADDISKKLREKQISHFKLSGEDVFRSDAYKTVLSHFNVIARDNSFMDWARILYATGSTNSFKDARNIMKDLRNAGMTPSDFINFKDSSYLREFCKSYKDKEIVIFDTETTGLNVYEDDIIQIAAIKVKNGKLVEGSELDIILETDKEIPEKLGSKVNPMVEVYQNREKMPRKEALEFFLDYVGDDEVLGHNSSYDLEILHNNVLRSCPGRNVHAEISYCWDSLKLIKLIRPFLKVYKLEALLQELGLEGINSHKANDDILATKSLVDWCFENADKKLEEQDKLKPNVNIRNAAQVLVKNYSDIYKMTISKLDVQDQEDKSIFAIAFKYAYDKFIERGFISEHDRISLVVDFLNKHILASKKANHLRTEMQIHLSELTTFNESDLCESDIVSEKVYIMTVYKAKGLEFENVIIYDAVEGTYPFFCSKTDAEKMEDKRLFYVAMSRAKKRLWISYHTGYYKQLTPFMNSIRNYFD